MVELTPPFPPSEALVHFWKRPVSELATVSVPALPIEEKQQHYLYSLLVLALVHRFFNGNKYGAMGDYPHRSKQTLVPGIYHGVPRYTLDPDKTDGSKRIAGFDFDYLGHNIACIAVDGDGQVIDFDFNHNEIFDSTMEHAESRLVRRIFGLTRIYDGWNVGERKESTPSKEASGGSRRKEKSGYSHLLKDVTIYTSLESCAQCAGIMALAGVKQVIYLQRDPGMYSVGNILYNLTQHSGKGSLAPMPLSADLFEFPYFDRLARAYMQFSDDLLNKSGYFYSNAVSKQRMNSPSITSFLCTDSAQEIFTAGAGEFLRLTANPEGATDLQKHLKAFFDYASQLGERGTPHGI